MFKRILLFAGVNILVVLTISAIMQVLGVRPYITRYGLDLQHLAIFCLLWGMVGSFISLAMSRMTAKWLYGIQLVNQLSPDPKVKELAAMVNEFARKAKLPEMPEVGIYESSELNAFATGPTKSRALVAVSTGLMNAMNKDQLAGVVAHEVSHIANDDMVTMTLLQGVVNAFVMFMSRAVAYAVTIGRDDEEGGISMMSYYVVRWILEFVFMALGAILVCWFSRKREYRADAGGAELAGREKMVSALEVLRIHTSDAMVRAKMRGSPLQAFMISGADQGILSVLYSTHPPLDDRIARLIGGGAASVAGGSTSNVSYGGSLPQREPNSARSSNSLRDSFGKRENL